MVERPGRLKEMDGTSALTMFWGVSVIAWIWSDGYLSCPGAEWNRLSDPVRVLQWLAGITVLLIALVFLRRTWLNATGSWLRRSALVNLGLVIVVGSGMSWSRPTAGWSWWWQYAHGCLTPLLLAGTIALASPWKGPERSRSAMPGSLRRTAPLTVLVVFAQVMLGALVRYLPVTSSPNIMRPLFLFHLVTASAVAVHILWLAWTTARLPSPPVRVLRWILALALLMVLQVGLGFSTWTVVLGWPHWFDLWVWTAGYTVQIGSVTASLILACHITNGALLLGISTVILLHALTDSAAERAVEAAAESV